jgi:hypothetical protein
VHTGEAIGDVVAGRVNAAVADPGDPNVMYIATDGARPTDANGGNPAGTKVIGLPDTGGAGVWKTNNWLHPSPPHWKPLTDDMPSPSVGPNGLVMSPTNTRILYAAADGPQGCILKTTNSGDNWNAFGQDIFAGVKFGGIAVSPVDPNTVYVGVFRPSGSTPGGVYKSIDGAETWSLAGNMQGDVSHVVIDPSNPNTLWAGFVDPGSLTQQGVWKSTDGGSSWQQQNANFPARTFNSVLFIEFAFAPSATQNMYAVVMQPQKNPVPEFYSTQAAGANWQRICGTTNTGKHGVVPEALRGAAITRLQQTPNGRPRQTAGQLLPTIDARSIDLPSPDECGRFDYEGARKDLRIPDEFQVEAMAAVGKPAPKELLPEKLQARESPNDRRKLSESIFEGSFKSK